MARSFAPALALALTALILAGCAGSADNRDSPTAEEIAHAEAQMRKLPSLEEAYEQHVEVVQQVAEAATAIAPELVWETKIDRAQGTLGCPGPYLKTEGVSKTTDTFYSPVPISDTAWPRIIDKARQIAAQHGMTVLTVFFDEPGRHDITLHSPDHGNEIRIGTRVAASVSGVTGCRYRAEDLTHQPHP